jgi:hypothetical protein
MELSPARDSDYRSWALILHRLPYAREPTRAGTGGLVGAKGYKPAGSQRRAGHASHLPNIPKQPEITDTAATPTARRTTQGTVKALMLLRKVGRMDSSRGSAPPPAAIVEKIATAGDEGVQIGAEVTECGLRLAEWRAGSSASMFAVCARSCLRSDCR